MILPFIVGVAIGIIGVYIVKPEQKVVHKYPNPMDKEKTVYKDKNGVCYTYSSKEMNCDKNETRLKPFPLSK
jgi:hypothetical protein